jgi:O-antigen/teichoic acid export membrane protein
MLMQPRTHISRHMAWVSAGNIVSKLLMFAANVWIANHLLDAAFGSVSVAFAIVNYIALVLFIGVDTIATRDAAGAAPQHLRRLAGELVTIRLWLVTLAIAVTLAVAMWLPAPAGGLTALYALSFVPLVLYAVNLMYGVEWSWPITAYFIGGRVVYVGLLCLLVHAPRDAASVPIAFALALCAENVFLFLLWQRRYGIEYPLRPRTLSHRWWAAVPVTLSSALLLLHENAGMLIVFIVCGAAATGVYSAGYRLVYIAISLAALLSYVFLARITRVVREQPRQARTYFRSMTVCALAGGALASAVGILLARPVVRLLYNPVYHASATIIIILAWQMLAAPARIMAYQTLNACGMQRRIVPWCALCAALSVSAVVCGCVVGAAPGAAMGMVIGELCSMVILVVLADRMTHHIATQHHA